MGDTAYGYAQGTGLVGCMGALYKAEDGMEDEPDPDIIPSIRNLGLTGYIYGRRMVGGFVGCAGGGANAAEHSLSVSKGIRLENLVNHADVYCTDSKGIAGIVACSMAKGSIINCYNTGNLDSTYGYPTGGIIGSNEETDVFCCYNTGTITSSTKNGRGIGSNNNGSHYVVDDCYYLEGCGDDLKYPGYYDYNLAESIQVDVSGMTAQEMTDGTLLAALNVNGDAYVAGDDGYPVLYWEKQNGQGSLSVNDSEGGTLTAQQTGTIDNGTVVYLENTPETGYKFRYYTLNGTPLSGKYVTVNGDCEISIYFESVKPGILKIAENEICNIQVFKNGIIKDAEGMVQNVTNYPVQEGDSLYEGDLLIIQASVKDGMVPENPDLQYSATAGLAVQFNYEYTYTGHAAKSTVVQTYTVDKTINEEDVYLTLNVIPATTQKLWRYIGDTSWYNTDAQEFVLTDANQLAGLEMLVNEGIDFAGKTIKLGNDISLKNNDGTEGKRFWDGIGTSGNPFAGTFDGQGHKITDYHGNARGLFAYIYGSKENRASVKNLELYGTASGVEAAGFASRAKYADFSQCTSYCKVENGSGWCGGIIGYAQAAVALDHCINYGKIEGISKLGGLVGELSADSSITDSVNKGDIICNDQSGNSVGGVVGSDNGPLTRCANYGTIEAAGLKIGGLCGETISAKGSVFTDCFNCGAVLPTESVNSNCQAGGLVGYGLNYKIYNSFNYGVVGFNTAQTGGLIGREGKKSTSLTSNAYYLGSTCKYAEAGTAPENLPEATYTAGMKTASADEFAAVNGVLAAINGNKAFTLLEQGYPEFIAAVQYHVHSGGQATCTHYAVCDSCGLEYGAYDLTVHGSLGTRNVKHAVWTSNGYTGDTYCKDCDRTVSSGEIIPANLERQALQVEYKNGSTTAKTKQLTVGQLDKLKETGPCGYTYGFDKDGKYTDGLMAATEYVPIAGILAQDGLNYEDLDSIVVSYGGNKDTITAETLKDCIYYYDQSGNRYDAPAVLAITYASLDKKGTLALAAGAAESNDDLRFAYGMSQKQYEDKAILGGRRLVSPVTLITVNIKDAALQKLKKEEENNPDTPVPSKISIAKAKVVLQHTALVYTGKKLNCGIKSITLNGKNLKAGRDYETTFVNNKNVGIATVKIQGKGYYTGTITKTFKINPKTVKLSSVKRAKKAFTATWKKQTTQVTGYQLQYSTNKSFKSGTKTIKIKNAKTGSKKITKLKAKKKYYVRIRTYKTVKGKTYYSTWSKAKTVTTK